MSIFLCLDIGGTFIKHSLYNLNSERMSEDLRTVTPSNSKKKNNILNKTLLIIKSYIEQYPDKIKGICISSAGVIDNIEGSIISAGETIPYFAGTKFKATIEKTFNIPCSVENDVNCALLGEISQKKLQGKNIFCLTIGTGIGGAFYQKDNIYLGSHNFSGEIGYMAVGNSKENFQQLGNTEALIQAINQNFPKYHCKNGHDIIKLINTDKQILPTIDTWLTHIARGIINIQYILDTDAFIIGGGIMENPLLIERLKKVVENIIHPNFKKNILLLPASLGNEAGKVGALYHFIQVNKTTL